MPYDRDYSERNIWARDADPARDYGSGRDYSYSSAREYQAAGEFGGREDRNFRGGGTGYGNDRGRETYGGNRDYYGGDRGGYGRQASGSGITGGSYGADGRRFLQQDDHDRGPSGRDRGYGNRDRYQAQGYGRQPQGYDYEERGFMARAGDEVRSWFGDDEAERRREFDQRNDERSPARGGHHRDADYHDWRRGQIDALDRDYHEYRQENAKKFESEFGSWRTNRQTQRASLSSVNEHMEVVGSDGGHVGTVDKVRGDRIVLTKNDADAGGRHHSIPSSWLQSVDDKVTISKTADEAKSHWRDEERSGAMFGDRDASSPRDAASRNDRDTNLDRSFSGTY